MQPASATRDDDDLDATAAKPRAVLTYPCNEIYDYNPLFFDFILKRTIRHPETK